MVEINPNEEFIKKNFDSLLKFIEMVEGQNSMLLKLFVDYDERYALCPASYHKDFYSAFPGGLCFHTLHLLKWTNKFSTFLCPDEFTKSSLLKISLLSEFGKVGDADNEYYIPKTDKWNLEKGNYYEINHNLKFMKIPHRSLMFAHQYGISLTQDEYLSIMLCDGQNDESNFSYKYKEPKLALVLQYANQWAQKIEKENKILWPNIEE